MLGTAISEEDQVTDEHIIAVYVVIDDLLRQLGHRDHPCVQLTDAEVLTVAVVAALTFQNHHARALAILTKLGYLSGTLSPSRFNRRLHALRQCLDWMLTMIGNLFRHRAVYLIDSLPLPICRRARAYRCGKARGIDFCGYCAAKKEKFFGYRLHLVCTVEGVPVAFTILPAAYHDLTPVHELTYDLPPGAKVCGDKAYNSRQDEASIEEDTGVRLVPQRKVNMWPNKLEDAIDLAECRSRIETVNSQLAAMGVQRLHARTNEGLELKICASLFALVCKNKCAA